MNNKFTLLLILPLLLLLTASCEHDEPENWIRPDDQRTVLFLTPQGKIFDQNLELVVDLPDCNFSGQIISDKGDYFVSGINQKEKIGYWKNGKWTTLHVDFRDDNDHWIYGMGKWEYNLYLLDYPNVLKNSGLFRLVDADRYYPGTQALAVSEGKCYVVGSKITDESNGNYLPVLYTEHKSKFEFEMLPVTDNTTTGECSCVYAYDRTHTLIGGSINGWPVLWVDKELQVLPLSEASFDNYDELTSLGQVTSLTECNGEIYAVGEEPFGGKFSVATIWHNGTIHHLQYFPEKSMSSESVKIMTYGDDFYIVTLEYYFDENDEFTTTTVLWKNEVPIKAYIGLQTNSFTVI